jgi:tetratricopeptide (TPR) repeat protein
MIGLGDVLWRRGDAERAHSAFSRAAALQPGSLEAGFGNALSLARLGRFAEAIDILQRMLGETPRPNGGDYVAEHGLLFQSGRARR